MAADDFGEQRSSELTRALGPRIATAMVVGMVIGSGIFFKPGQIAANVGDFRIIIGVWVFGGLLCILGTLCLAELASMFPEAGGLYVYLRETYGPGTAFLFGWCEFLFAKPAGIGALAVAFIGSFSLAFLDVDPSVGLSLPAQIVCVSAIVVGLATVNVLGVIWGGRLQLVITLIKAFSLALVALLPFLFAMGGHATVHASNYSSTIVPAQTTFTAQAGAALLSVMWAYHGWHGITPLAEEIRDPQRNIPLALFAGIGILVLLYVSANIAYHGVLSMEQLAAAGDHGAEQSVRQVLESVFGASIGSRAAAAMSLVIMCSTFGAINSNLMEAPRVTFAMGRDGVFFRSLGAVHPRFRTPAVAILVTALMSIAVVVIAGLGKIVAQQIDIEPQSPFARQLVNNLRQGSLFELLTNFVVFMSNLFFALTVLAVIILRRRLPDRVRTYRTWGYPAVPVAYLLITAWFLWEVFRGHPLESMIGIGLTVLGLPVYWFFRRRGRMAHSAGRLATVLLALLAGVGCIGSSISAAAGAEPIKVEELYARRIQPLLERHCYDCHSEKANELKGNLRLDKIELILKGGNNGPAVVPGDNNSFLLRSIRYQEDDYKMPPRAKLADDEIRDFERWVKAGARGPAAPRRHPGEFRNSLSDATIDGQRRPAR
ncbi:MAG: amino acid permease [Planctomycetes bacterium]|nr:amino acid permease [Planctomycetota bacterium]